MKAPRELLTDEEAREWAQWEDEVIASVPVDACRYPPLPFEGLFYVVAEYAGEGIPMVHHARWQDGMERLVVTLRDTGHIITGIQWVADLEVWGYDPEQLPEFVASLKKSE